MSRKKIFFLIILFVLTVVSNLGLYACTNSDCQNRGGHTEIVWSYGGWVCEGAKR